jgi:purine nucleosidase/pyrimidine-specific ribonucleoside hydrolase
LSPENPHSQPRAVLIDTDIGDDVDDAFGLALAARHPALRLCGVTTVCGPVQRRARLARIILAAAGQPDVPVAPGSSSMSDRRPGSARFSHQPLIEMKNEEWRMEKKTPSDSSFFILHSSFSTDLILDCSQQHDQLTLIALGPLTNIAAALRRDPALARRARLVAMAGKLGLPYPDWNLRCDPAAARAVLASGMPVTLVGMHVTLRCKLRPAQLRRLFAGVDPLMVALARCVLAWRTWKRRMPILHDALAVAVAAGPAVVALDPRRVRVLAGGFSLASRRGAPNTQVCMDVDLGRFHALIDGLLLGGAAPGDWAPGAIERILQIVV